jgi:transcriptional regulator with XRE-family HTH domain
MNRPRSCTARTLVLTLEELAEKAGVGRNTIWRLEHGVMGAQPRTIRTLAKPLDVEPEELVKTGDDDG